MAELSLRAYARRRGVNLNAVQKAISSGRIQKTASGRIDPDDADARWAGNTDPSQQRGTPRDTPAGGAGQSFAPDLTADMGKPQAGTGTLLQAKTVREAYQARLARLKYEELSGTLVNAADVEAQWGAIITRAKAQFESVPAKLRMRIPDLTGEDMAAVEDVIRSVLEALADDDDATGD